MSTIKTILSVLAILCAYGVVGRMDYDDAVMMEQTETRAAKAHCSMAAFDSPLRRTQPMQTGPGNISDEPAPRPADPCNVVNY